MKVLKTVQEVTRACESCGLRVVLIQGVVLTG